MNPYLSWVIVLLVAGGLGWYYRDKSSARTRVASNRTGAAEKSEQLSTTKKTKRRAKKQDDTPSSSATPMEQQQQKEDDDEATVNKSQPVTSGAGVETGMDNLQFAKEFSKAKTGTSLSSPPASSTDKGSKKKSRGSKGGSKNTQKESVAASNTSASSTTGAEADDDMSPISTPQEAPVTANKVDVSDMLEAPAPAASVLRVTGSVDSDAGKKKHKAENFKVAETKKQRQRRLKKENNRALVQDSEQQRRDLLEKHLHTAREFERQEAAKSKPAQAPAANDAWKQGPPSTEKTNGAQKQKKAAADPTTTSAAAALLDTFDADTEKPSPQKKPAPSKASNSTTGKAAQNDTWAQSLPSEEEQLRIINSMNSESEWTTVSNRKKDRKNKVSDTASEASSVASFTQPTQTPAPAPAPAPAPTQGSNAWTALAENSNGKNHPLDSDWPA